MYWPEHLAGLKAALDAHPEAVLAYSGVRHHYNRECAGPVPGEPLQLVQCLHRRLPERWTERDELESDDLERLYWHKLRAHGAFVPTSRVSCEWVDHPHQRHKLMREPVGGINPFRQHYRVRTPLRFHTTVGQLIDEPGQYGPARERADTPAARDGLKILLVGELAYNADRVLALEEAGHRLWGLWMPKPYWYNSVGPLPFGHVRELPRDNWPRAVRELQPDLIYALLNWQAVPFAHEVMQATRGIPFVWHFKEGPFICLEKGTWRELIELHQGCDGQIFSSPEMRDWFDTVVPGLSRSKPTHVLDGDLPKRDWFDAPPSAASTCTSTATSRTASGANGSSAPAASRRATCTCMPTSTRAVGCGSSRATTPAGCTAFAAPTRASCAVPTGTTSTTRRAWPRSPRPGCR